jgi:hypothetical protein
MGDLAGGGKRACHVTGRLACAIADIGPSTPTPICAADSRAQATQAPPQSSVSVSQSNTWTAVLTNAVTETTRVGH